MLLQMKKLLSCREKFAAVGILHVFLCFFSLHMIYEIQFFLDILTKFPSLTNTSQRMKLALFDSGKTALAATIGIFFSELLG